MCSLSWALSPMQESIWDSMAAYISFIHLQAPRMGRAAAQCRRPTARAVRADPQVQGLLLAGEHILHSDLPGAHLVLCPGSATKGMPSLLSVIPFWP